MTAFVVYTAASGEIVRTGTAPATMVALQAQTGEEVLEGDAVPGEDYVDLSGTPAIAAKTTLGISVTDDTISSIPAGTLVSCRALGISSVVNDGTAVIEADVPGTWEVTLSNSPAYIEETVEVTTT